MTKTFKDIQGIEEACWVGYKKVGMKKKGDRMVPNCVKEEVVDNLLGKDYVYESVGDMYKGQFTKAQLAKMKQTWSTKKASDVDQRTKDFVKNLDQFTQMDIKQANIKYISNLIAVLISFSSIIFLKSFTSSNSSFCTSSIKADMYLIFAFLISI